MKLTKVILLVFLLFLFVDLNAQEKYSKVHIFYPVNNIEQRNNILGLLQIDHFDEDKGVVIAEVKTSLLTKLDAIHARYEVEIDDVMKNLESLNKKYFEGLKDPTRSRVAIEQPGGLVNGIIKTPSHFVQPTTFGGYWKYAQMDSIMTVMATTYSSICTKTSIGTTIGGRNIWLMKISDNVVTDETNEPEVLYLGLQHAREAVTGSSMIFFLMYLCENYASDPRVKDLIDNREIYIVPCFNPDGWEYNRTSSPGGGTTYGGTPGGDWRKNRRNNGDGTFGVDLNRNWGVDWSDCNAPILGNVASCGSSNTADETYWGTAAFSEAETQAVRNFVKAHHVVAGFDQHAFGPYYSLPFGRHSKHTMTTKGQNFYTAIPALMGTYNGMRAGDSYEALHYEVAGGFKDWMLIGELGSTSGSGLKDTVWAMTGEGGAGGGATNSYAVNNGTQSFWAPASQILNLSKGMCYQNLQLAFAAGSYVDIQDVNDITMTTTSGNLSFSVKRLGLGNDPVTISLVPISNMNGPVTSVTINSMNYYAEQTGSLSYTLPSTITNGQMVRYAWKVQTGGYTYSDTISKLLNPVSIFSDNMEGATVTTNWSITGGGWDYSTDGAYAGSKSLTESPGGNYGTSANLQAAYKNSFSLTDATAAYLSFWTKYRAENFRDKLQVQVSLNSTDGTDGTWTAVIGSTTIQEPGTLDNATLNGQPALTGIRDYWTHEVYDLSSFKGAGSGTMRFRFAFTSDSDPTTFSFEKDDGFYIDNLRLVKTTSALVTLPVHFVSFTGKLQGEQVRLDWSAVTDDRHHHFEVEHSTDGINFSFLADGPSTVPYWAVDSKPARGNNFYRIKQIDIDGKYAYSSIVLVEYNPDTFEISLYPNPVLDVLNIQVQSGKTDSYQVILSDVIGRNIYETRFTSSLASQGLKIPMNGRPSQLYIVTVKNSKNEVVATQKFVKQ